MSHEIHEPEPEEERSFQTIIGEDPWLEEFARSPYDPLNSARATGRLTGLAARHVYRQGWMRVAAFLVGLTLVGGSFGIVAAAVVAGSIANVIDPANLLGAVILIPTAIVGVRLIAHAIGR